MKTSLLLALLATGAQQAHGAYTPGIHIYSDTNAQRYEVDWSGKAMGTAAVPHGSGTSTSHNNIQNTVSSQFSASANTPAGQIKFWAGEQNGATAWIKQSARSCSACDSTVHKTAVALFGDLGACPETTCVDNVVSSTGTLCDKPACDPITKCSKCDSTKYPRMCSNHPSAGNACVNAYVTTAGNQCTCGTNQDPANDCKTCASGWTNYPFCNHYIGATTANIFSKANICPKGTLNADMYFHKSPVVTTQCGKNSCGGTEKCCNQAVGGHWASDTYRPENQKHTAAVWTPQILGADNSFCIDKSFTCCGDRACGPGLKCLNPAIGLCADEKLSHDITGLTPCFGGGSGNNAAHNYGARLNNGTLTPKAQRGSTSVYCNEFQTCCDGVCCHKSHSCEARGKSHLAADGYGWDFMFRTTTTANAAFRVQDSKYCNTNPFNGFHTMRIVFVPLFLTFAYLLLAVLGLKTGAPAPIKIICLVVLVLCIFQSYSLYWRNGVFVALVIAYTMWAQGNGEGKPRWTALMTTIVHVILISAFFGLGTTFFYNFTGTQMQEFFPKLRTGISARQTACYSEFNYFYESHDALSNIYTSPTGLAGATTNLPGATTDTRIDFGTPLGITNLGTTSVSLQIASTLAYGQSTMAMTKNFFGYCNMNWFGALDFFFALEALLLLALVGFTFKQNFGGEGAGGAAGNKVVAQEVEVP